MASTISVTDDRPARFWAPRKELVTLMNIQPLLASWESRTNPAQMKLQAYLGELERGLDALPTDTSNLFLHMEIDVVEPIRLLRHYDLENYLTPVVHRLGARRFLRVSAHKRVGGGSMLTAGVAEPSARPDGSWQSFSCHPVGSISSSAWKKDLRARLDASAPAQLPPGPVEVQMAWRVAPTINWVNLWKSTGDAMGPVLGAVDPSRPFQLNDDRITRLELHLDADRRAPVSPSVSLFWRPGQ